MAELVKLAEICGNFYALPPLIVGLLTLVLGFVVFVKERGSATSFTFLGLTLCGSFWLLSYPLIYSASGERSAFFWIKAENAVVTFIPTFMLLFSLSAASKLRRFGALALGVFVLSAVFFCLVVFNGGFLAGTFRYPWGYYARYGFSGTVFILFFFSVMAASLVFFAREYRRAQTPIQKKRFQILLAGLSIGYLGSVDFLPAYGIPLYPFGYLPVFIFLVMMAYGLGRYRLIAITPSFAADQILKTLADGLMVLDREGNVRVANEAACALFGIPAADLAGKPVSLLGLDFFRKENLSRLFWTGSVQHHEVRLDRLGAVRMLDISSSVIHDKAGDSVALVFILKDVTGRKKAEEAVRASELHYRLLAENVMDVIWTMDMNMKLTYVSPSVLKLRGYTPEEAQAQSLAESLTPRSLKAMLQAIAELQMQENAGPAGFYPSRELELEYLCKDGSAAWTEVKMTLYRGEEGRAQGMLGVVRDIRARRQSEEAMRAAERSYTDLFQVTADPIVMLNSGGMVQSVNPAAERMLGYHAAELMEKPFLKMGLFQPNSESHMLQEFTYLMLGWQRVPFDARLTAKDGSSLIAEIHPRLLRTRENVKAQLIFRNIRVHPADRSLSA